LLFSDAWFIVAKSLLIPFQLLSCLTHHFMSSIDLFLKIFFYDQVTSINIQYLEVALINSFLVMSKPLMLNQINIFFLLIHVIFLLGMT
jgi:hypothetical protein